MKRGYSESSSPLLSHLIPEEVEDIISYKFKNKNLLEERLSRILLYVQLFLRAFWRRGRCGAEFLLFCREHYSLYPDLAPGKLTRLRAANVDTEKLARVALRHGFHRYLRHRKPFLVDQIQEFARAVSRMLLRSTIGAVFMDWQLHRDCVPVFKGLAGAAKDALDNRWKWMQNNNAVIAHQLVTEDQLQPLLLNNMKTENNE
ncbi:hypothetical protein M0R45_023835 [Rubus argutus]|uniref:RNase III domain-containing protein n=1 Tax=Rubus argutus TaxID=59490 RepID=A0AAW1WPR4_RUBAR